MAEEKLRITDEVINMLMSISMFDMLDSEELRIVASYMNFVEVEADNIVFREGKPGNYVCFVVEGSLEVLKYNEKGKLVPLTVLARGKSLGEMSILDNMPRSATVRARTPAVLLTLSRRAFNKIVDKYPRIGIKIIRGITRTLSQNLRYSTACLADLLEEG